MASEDIINFFLLLILRIKLFRDKLASKSRWKTKQNKTSSWLG